MTTQRRVIAEVSEIVGVEMECLKCRCRRFISVEHINSKSLVSTCPDCKAPWFSGQGSPDHSHAQEFIEKLKALLESEPKPSVSLRLEIKPEALG
jgi:hypothetical protein